MSTTIFNTIVAAAAAIVTTIYFGPGAGAAVFSAISIALSFINPGQPNHGPLDDIRATKSAYGEFIPIAYNNVRLGSHLVWASKVRAKPRGHGGFEYGQDLLYAVCEAPRLETGAGYVEVQRIWLNKQLIYDIRPGAQLSNIIDLITSVVFVGFLPRLQPITTTNGIQIISILYGDPDQGPSPLIAKEIGEANTPAYRGLICIQVANCPLHLYGNAVPMLEVELAVSTLGTGSEATPEAWYPLRSDYVTNFESTPYRITIDRPNNRVIQWMDYGTKQIYTSDLTTGDFIETHTLTSILGAGKVILFPYCFTLGTDGNLYTIRADSGVFPSNPAFYSSIRLSKIDLTSWTEVDDYGPPLTHATSSYVDYKLVAFELGGTNYVAIYEQLYNSAYFEVVNVDTMTSVSSTTVPNGTGLYTDTVVGPQVSGEQKLYLFGTTYTDGTTWVNTISFDGAAVSVENSQEILPTDISPFWQSPDFVLYPSSGDYVQPFGLMFDPTDGNVIVTASLYYGLTGTADASAAYLIKVQPSDGAVLWTVPIPNGDLDAYTQSACSGAEQSDLSNGILYYAIQWADTAFDAYPFTYTVDDTSGVLLVIDTSDGSFTAVDTPHFLRSGDNAYAVQISLDSIGSVYWSDYTESVTDWFGGWAVYSPATEGAVSTNPFTLEDICVDQTLRTGMVQASDLNYAALATIIPKGYPVTSRRTAKDNIEETRKAFLFDIYESGWTLKARLREGVTSVATISEDDVVVDNGVRSFVFAAANSQEFPRWVDLSYFNYDLSYQVAIESARIGGSSASGRNAQKLSVGVVMISDEAATSVQRIIRAGWAEAETTKLMLPIKYLAYEPSDVITLTKGSYNFEVKLGAQALGVNWAIANEAVSHDSGTYSSLAKGSAYQVKQERITVVSPPVMAVMDTASLDVSDDNVGLYATAFPSVSTVQGGTWPGADIQKGTTDTVFVTKASLIAPPTAGTVADPTADFTSGSWDRETTIVVALTSGKLYSASETDLWQSETNLSLLGDELLQFATALEVAPGTWWLTDLLRGRRGTEQFTGTHGADENFVLIDRSLLFSVTYSASEIDATRYYRASNDSLTRYSDVVTSAQTTRRLMPYAPSFIRGVRVGDNLTVSFIRRSRVEGSTLWDAPLFEASAVFECDIYDGGDVVRTITATPSANGSVVDPVAFTVYYDEDDQTLDFGSPQASIFLRIYQLNAIRGRGYAGSKTV